MRVFWGSSYGRSVDIPHLMALLRLTAHCAEVGVPLSVLPTWGDALIERSRSRSATRFLLDSTADVWLSVDGDVEFKPAQALGLCRQALELGAVVGGLYVTRSRRGAPACLLEDGTRYFFGKDPAPLPVRYAATGFMAVPRVVFSRLAEGATLYHPGEQMQHYDFFSPLAGEDRGAPIRLSEDWAFCERARRAGFPVLLNPAIRLAHWGAYPFQIEDLFVEQPEPQEVALTRTAEGLRVEHAATGTAVSAA